jgi:hypothetical protein
MKHTFAVLVIVAVIANTQAAEVESRYGVVKALPISAGEKTLNLLFEDKQIAQLEAESVSLLRVTPNGEQEHIVIEKWMPGLHCHKTYMLLTITQEKKAAVSPPFGECMELAAATYLKNGVTRKLRASYNPDAMHPKYTSFTWANGQLHKH